MPHHYRVVFLAGEDGGDGMMIDELMREISAILVEACHSCYIYPKSEDIYSIQWINLL